MFDRLLIH